MPNIEEIAEIASHTRSTDKTSSDGTSMISVAYPNELEIAKSAQVGTSPTSDYLKPVVFKLSSLR